MKREERTVFQQEDGKEGKLFKVISVTETTMNEREWLNYYNGLCVEKNKVEGLKANFQTDATTFLSKKRGELEQNCLLYSSFLKNIEEGDLIPAEIKLINEKGEKSE